MTEEYVRKSDVVKVLTNNRVHFCDMVKITSEINSLDTFEFNDQESVIDEIKAEIDKLDGMYVLKGHVFYAEKIPKHAWLWYIRLKEVIDILDRYKIESEDGNPTDEELKQLAEYSGKMFDDPLLTEHINILNKLQAEREEGENKMTEEQLYMVGVNALIAAKHKEKKVEPEDISDIYPETIFKRPCSNCENEDSINICDQCCFKYDSWFRKKEKEEKKCTDCKWYGFTCECPAHCTQDTKIAWESATKEGDTE